MQVDWELSQSLTSDGHGVRGVAIGGPSSEPDAFALYTGTQAGTLMEFGIPSANLDAWPYQHDEVVSSLCLSDEYIFTGSKDSKIRVFHAKTRELQHTLAGHEKNVTSLSCLGDYLVSGSWDGTAKVWNWKRQVLMATLSGHENSVSVAIVGLTDDQNNLQVVTGSAGMAHPDNRVRDHTVRLWTINIQNNQVNQVYAVANDHEGPIRDVCVFDHEKTRYLATCSNDGTVKLRSLETGVPTATLFFVQQQHPPMLLSLCYTTEGCLVASAEDGTVIVWDMANATGIEPQTISHTSCIWRVAALPNGDFCSAAEDGTVRIFTRATERMAPQSEREAFGKEAEAALAKKRGGPTPEEIAKLPRWENNFEKRGTSEGQVQLWQKNGIAIASQWSAASQTWIEVGEVMGSAGGGSGGNENEGFIDGVSYDHVLPVELENNGSVVNLKIGYNTGENPFVASQRFIDNHMLPQYHLAQIADYIQQRTGANAGAPMIGMAADRPSAATTGIPMAAYQYIPVKLYLAFELSSKSAATTMDKMKAKLAEFNKLSEDEFNRVGALMEVIQATSRYHATKVPDLKILLELLNKLDPSQTFPVLDLARLTALHPDATDQNQPIWTEIFLRAIELMQVPASDLGEGPAAGAIPMLTLRLFANSLKGGTQSRRAVLGLVDPILTTCVRPLVASSNKNIRLSVATLLHNLACCAHMNKASSGSAGDAGISSIPAFMDIVSQVLSHHKLYDETAVMRTLQALGTLVMAVPEAKHAANALFLASKVEPAASPHSATVKVVAKEVYNVLQQ